MQKFNLRDERGVAMVVELVLVALVLSFVGLAVWQANQHSKKATPVAVTEKKTTVTTATAGASADAAVKIVQDDSVADSAISSAAQASQESEFSAVSNEATNLGGSFNDSDF